MQPLGLYLSIPFCKAKCTFCNFASDAFPPERMESYVDRMVAEIAAAPGFAAAQGLLQPSTADTVFFGGGTPSLLSPGQMTKLFAALRGQFQIAPGAEITVEAAPGQISDALLDVLLQEGVNRISLGVQSFVDAESRAVGRLHTAEQCLAEIARLRARGMRNLNVDLIAGLPHQTRASWAQSIQTAVQSGVDHISVYMLEVDEDSRLGRELIGRAGHEAVRYSADAAPDEALTAELYSYAVDALNAAGLRQYEISNFAREGLASQHNLKYWTRAPYLGFGLDAHSMLRGDDGQDARFANEDDLGAYLSAGTRDVERVDALAQFEEAVFLGLRLTEGIDIEKLRSMHDRSLVEELISRFRDLERNELAIAEGGRLRLTHAGRLVSSSIFGELLAESYDLQESPAAR